MSVSPNNSVNAAEQEMERLDLRRDEVRATFLENKIYIDLDDAAFIVSRFGSENLKTPEQRVAALEAIRAASPDDGNVFVLSDRMIERTVQQASADFHAAQAETQAQTRWTLQQFSTNPVGEPWLALQEKNQAGEVQRGFTGTRREMDEIISEHNLTVTELAPVTEHQYETQHLNGDAALDLPIGSLAARSALEAERQSILAEAQTPHESSLDGALKSYLNGRADAYNNIRNALAESSTVELPSVIEPEEIAVISPELAMDDRQQSLAMGL